MKNLKEICNINILNSLHSLLEASILDINDTLNNDYPVIVKAITDFINEKYNCYGGSIKISKTPNAAGKYEVSARDVKVKDTSITSLTNDVFVWLNVDYFDCSDCENLQSLEGGPRSVKFTFNCKKCNSLKDLTGAPDKVGIRFCCSDCKNLQSLNGCPQKIGKAGIRDTGFFASGCTSLTSLKGMPEKVIGDMYIYNCSSLTSLEGAPAVVVGSFDCSNCSSLTSLEGAPTKVGYKSASLGTPVKFDCSNCENLKSLKGSPKTIIGDFDFSGCQNITKYDATTKKVDGDVYGYNCGVLLNKDDIHDTTKVEFMAYVKSKYNWK